MVTHFESHEFPKSRLHNVPNKNFSTNSTQKNANHSYPNSSKRTQELKSGELKKKLIK